MEELEFYCRIAKLRQDIATLKARAKLPEEATQKLSEVVSELQDIMANISTVTSFDLHHVVEEGCDSVIILDQNGHLLFSNLAGRDLLNLPDNLLGKDFGIPLVTSEPQEVNIMQYEKGHIGIAEMIVRRISWANKPAYLLRFHDVTAYKQVEENLLKSRNFIEEVNQLLPSIIYVYDLIKKEIIYVNDQLVTFFEHLAPQAQLPGQPILTALLHPEDKEIALQHHEKLLSIEDGEVVESEYRVKHPDKTWHWVWVRTLIFSRTYNGHPQQALGMIQDMTAHKLAELTLNDAKNMAEAANRAKSTFLANMSHELRTPLNAILGYTQILKRDGILTVRQQEGINIIHRSAEYLLTLISDILDLSKIEADQFELYPVDFELQTFFKEIVSLFKIRAKQKNIAFHYETLSTLPKVVRADERRLRQILINLLSNAVKFTDQGSVTLKVEYYAEKIHFQVEDTGVGISYDYLDKIFLPFQQISRTGHAREGTGLGLFITKRLIDMMGGRLDIESVFGKGSTFCVELDLPFVANSHIEQPEPAKITSFTGGNRKVLVVDDKWENRAVLVNLLAPLGFDLEEAVDGREGVEKAILSQPDLILMDLVMPNMDGFEATRRIRQHPTLKNVIIIAVSASAFDFHRQESRAVGCDDFVTKPVYVEDLLNCLQYHLQLNWIYEQKPTFFSVDEELPTEEIDDYLKKLAGASLTPEQATALFEQAKIGDIQGVIDYTQVLEQSNTELKPFLEKIRLLAENLDDQRICEILQRYLDNLT